MTLALGLDVLPLAEDTYVFPDVVYWLGVR